MSDLVEKTGVVTHDEAERIFKALHRALYQGGPKPPLSIPCDFARDPDVRMSSYFEQQRRNQRKVLKDLRDE